ncbi:putative phage abortive infection protein [Rhizobium sp. L245/93]|uniref:putative phage abortive infection protein n=1 Tax=Rhizobium sp. L245/93 TaxID=2819998 RepID=UPI001FFE1E5C|nr:putative phage abortive infection protein [Rhizobium sp. L245/93]
MPMPKSRLSLKTGTRIVIQSLSWPRLAFERFLAPAGDGSRASLFYLFVAALVIFVGVMLLGLFVNSTVGNNYGAFVGGILGPGLTFISFMALLITIVLQQTELADTRKELATSAKALTDQYQALDRQNFETTFFRMLTLHNTIVNSIDLEWKRSNPSTVDAAMGNFIRRAVGRDCFKQFFANYSDNYNERPEEDERTRLQAAYSKFWDFRQQDLAHYYRYLYNVLRFVHEQKGVDDKMRYVKLLRAQLSDYELLLLFYTALNKNGLNYWVYIHEYELFDNLPPIMLIKPGHKALYSDRSFGEPRAIKADIWPPRLLAASRDAENSQADADANKVGP